MNGREKNDSGSHCNGSWKLGPLIGIYTSPCCGALLYLDPVAKFIWKVEGPLLLLLDSQGALCGLFFILSAVFPFYQRATLEIPVLPIACSVGLHYWQRKDRPRCWAEVAIQAWGRLPAALIEVLKTLG